MACSESFSPNGRRPLSLRPAGKDEWIFIVSLILIGINLVDDVIEGRAFGVVPSLLWAPPMLFLAIVGAIAFVKRGKTARSLLAAGFAVTAILVGLVAYVPHIVLVGPGGTDFTGILLTAAELALLWLAVRIGFRGWRLRVKAPVAIALLFVLLQWGMVPAVNAGVATNVPRSSSPSASALGVPGAVDVTFPARDGVPLVGWYVPGQNGAAMILLSGSHGTRAELVPELRMLVQAGYAVLAIDTRGHGQSGGVSNAFGWLGDEDVAGAVDFLKHQAGIDPNRIGALGLSMGGEEALRAAGDGIPLCAVVADGPGAQTMGEYSIQDQSEGILAPIAVSSDWLMFRMTEFLTGEREPPSLVSVVGNVHVPVLIISSNKPGELALDQIFRDKIGQNASLWYVPDAGHTQALSVHPQDYSSRVTSFLERATGSPGLA